MPDRPRYYLTTAIAYANNKPGLHTLYEVIGADVIARWHRMKGDDTRFLTGTDEHSVNIAQSALDEGRAPRAFVDEMVGCFQAAEDALVIAPDRFIRTTDPDHLRAAQEMVRRAHANGDIYLGTYEGWYCPNEGFRNATDVQETARGTHLPEPPRRPAPVADRAELVLPPVGLPGAAASATSPSTRTSSSPSTGATRCSASSAAASRTSRSSRERTPGGWGIPFPIAENGETALREDGIVGPRGRRHLRLVRRAHQLHHRRRLPGRPGGVRAVVAGRPARHRQGHHPLPHDLLAGDADERRARGAAPGLGPRLAAGRRGERMSKSRGNFLDPNDVVAAFGADGARYVVAARGPVRPRRRGVVGLVRPPLQRRPRQRLRQPRSTGPSR